MIHKRIQRTFKYCSQIILIINPQFIGCRQIHCKKSYIKQISKKIKENMVLRFKEREEAIQLITMDPKVCGKLLTTHRRGLGDDVKALHGRFPLWRRAGEGSKMGSRGYRRLRRWKQFFVVTSDVFEVHGYMQEEEVGRWTPEGPTRQGARLVGGLPPPSWSLRLFLDFHSKSYGSRLFQKDRSRRFHSVWTPFDIPFLRNTEIDKKNSNSGWASGQQVSPKNDIKV